MKSSVKQDSGLLLRKKRLMLGSFKIMLLMSNVPSATVYKRAYLEHKKLVPKKSSVCPPRSELIEANSSVLGKPLDK